MAHTYSASINIDALPEVVYSYLTTPSTQNVYLPDSTVALMNGPDVTLGSSWMEARKSLLFLRDWAKVACTALIPGQLFAVCLDDGCSCINVTYQVQGSSTHATVTEEVACFTRMAGGRLSPSERLACMFKKHDQRLRKLKMHLEMNSHVPSPPQAPMAVDFSFPVLAS